MLGLGPIASRPVAAIISLETLTSSVFASAAPFALSAQDAALRPARKLPIGAGSFTLSAQTVTFAVSASQVGLNSIVLVGSTAAKNHGYTMIQDFRMTAGDSKTLVVTVKDGDGNRVNITSATIKWRCARSHRKSAVISKQTSGSGIAITDATNGEFTVTLDPSDTDSLYGTYYHEAEVTSSSGDISTVLNGTMKVNRALITAS